jgi:hypothetical protein
MRTRQIGRDARNGRFVPLRVTRRRPNTTTVETIRTRGAAKRKRAVKK